MHNDGWLMNIDILLICCTVIRWKSKVLQLKPTIITAAGFV